MDKIIAFFATDPSAVATIVAAIIGAITSIIVAILKSRPDTVKEVSASLVAMLRIVATVAIIVAVIGGIVMVVPKVYPGFSKTTDNYKIITPEIREIPSKDAPSKVLMLAFNDSVFSGNDGEAKLSGTIDNNPFEFSLRADYAGWIIIDYPVSRESRLILQYKGELLIADKKSRPNKEDYPVYYDDRLASDQPLGFMIGCLSSKRGVCDESFYLGDAEKSFSISDTLTKLIAVHGAYKYGNDWN